MLKMLKQQTEVGYPSRPRGGGELPNSFKLLHGEIATPKLNGHRVLLSDEGVMYNRLREYYTKLDDEDRAWIANTLCHTENAELIKWWDLECIPHGPNKGSVVILDVVPRTPYWDYDYHERRKLYEHIPTVNPFSGGYELRYSLADCDQRRIWKMNVATKTEHAVQMYDRLRKEWHTFMDESYLWEGIVVKDATAQYRLKEKQSMNMHMEVKYRFR
jgi:hypothetical protein